MISPEAAALIAAHRRPRVLGVVEIGATQDLPDALFEALAHASEGADGLDVAMGGPTSPADRLDVADQLAAASGLPVSIRTDTPMSAGDHALILSGAGGRLRASANVLYDLEVDRLGVGPDDDAVKALWARTRDGRPWLVSTSGFASISPAQVMGLAVTGFHHEVSAVSTRTVRTVRRVLDTLAPLSPRVPSGSVSSCP